MSLLTAKLHVIGDKATSQATILFDTGASHSFIRRDLAERIATISRLPRPLRFTVGDGRTIEVSDQATILIEVPSASVLDTMMVIDQGVEEIVLGASTMRKFGLKLDLEHSTVFAEIREELEIVPAEKKGTEEKMETILKTVLGKLGIEAKEGMTDEQAIAAIVGHKAPANSPVASPAVLAALELSETASEADVKGKILALTHRADVVPAGEHAALKEQLHQQEVRNTVTEAISRDGKLTPAEKDWAMTEAAKDLPAFKVFLANRPRVTPIGEEKPRETITTTQTERKPIDVMAIYAERRKARAA